MKYPDDMDAECVPLCDAMNTLPGIATVASCCGHGKSPFRVFFTAEAIESLLPIVDAIDGSGWHVEADIAVMADDRADIVMFLLEGPAGQWGTNDIVSWLELTMPERYGDGENTT